MMRWRHGIIFTALVTLAEIGGGCGVIGGSFADGNVRVCFDLPDSQTENSQRRPEGQTVRVEGRVVYDKKASAVSDPVADNCDPTRVLKIDDGNKSYRIGYRAETKAADVTPDAGLKEGEKVELTMNIIQPWWTSRAFAVARKNGGLALAVNDGNGAKIPVQDLDGMDVKVGDKYGTAERGGCGKKRARELRFDGETDAVLKVGERSQIKVSSGTVHVLNVVTYEYEKLNCTDTSAPRAWVAWR